MIRIADYITKAAWHSADKPSLTHEGRTFTWAETEERCWGFATALYDMGVRPGDRVAYLGLNSHRYYECYFVPSRIGAAVVTINYRLAIPEMIDCLNDCVPKVLIVDDLHLDQARAVMKACDSIETLVYAGDGTAPDDMVSYENSLTGDRSHIDFEALGSKDNDPVTIFYTGGTTGKSKGVELSHINHFSNSIGGINAYGFREAETHLLSGPMFHLGAGARVFWSVVLGAHTVIIPKFDVLDLMRVIPEYGIDTIQMVPTMVTMIFDHPQFSDFDLSSVRLITYGAAPMPVALMRRAMEALPNATFCQGFGMTETSPVLTVLRPQDHALEGPMAEKLNSIGKVIGHVDLRIVDPDDNPLPVGKTGEIVTRGPHVMVGYLNKPEQTAIAKRGGWYHTGDTGYIDEDGFVFLTGRIKDMIISGGENIYPIEIENVLSLHPTVNECAVIGLPDEHWGEVVHAVVTPAMGKTVVEDEIIDWCRENLAHYKCPGR